MTAWYHKCTYNSILFAANRMLLIVCDLEKKNHEILATLQYKPLYNISSSESGVKKIQNAAYNGARTAIDKTTTTRQWWWKLRNFEGCPHLKMNAIQDMHRPHCDESALKQQHNLISSTETWVSMHRDCRLLIWEDFLVGSIFNWKQRKWFKN